ncbi:phenylacetate--CoA ligase [Roseospira marina]|uniref:Phenylacetate--CoA ligase n=1 Tax=Roseospira marina TaxID=140057 RepID=A0A5M6IG34_9PROT|nr:AMP-binding protein [Roseospira marina]KAA5607112.1 phenylacetate--CoA ligase [Roseospira marina]MBB4312692.1 phenylacetate-CoA ligase [Roseospira marina]MBB5086535.1 phenylacetate-CoA ligase [Roseospira marina]
MDYFDDLETRPETQRLEEQFAALPGLIALAKSDTGHFGGLLADVDPDSITDPAALARLPVTRKSDLIALQKAHPPLGGLVSDWGGIGRILQSPGPINDPEGARTGYWRLGRALFAAGFRRGDMVQNCFSYHFTPGGWIFDDACRSLGCPVFPAGVGNTEQQVQAMAGLGVAGYVGTPSFLRIILEKANAMGVPLPGLTKGLVSGEAYLPPQRAAFHEAGLHVHQCYATADLGLIAYESPAADGTVEGMVVDEGVIVEIVRPGTGDPVPVGEVGEVVVTSFTPEYPLIRFATGDMSAVLPGESPCGRTNMRIKGWMGRADQTTKVKGMFVHPEQVADVLKRFPVLGRGRLVVSHDGHANDVMTLRCECAEDADDVLVARVGEAVQAVTKLKGVVEIVGPETLPNDGKVIEDARSYE